MRLRNSETNPFIPDNELEEKALNRISHLGVGAHQDDLEIMAFHGIKECFDNPDLWFGGIICTTGEGSPGGQEYVKRKKKKIAEVRRREQEKAAKLGRYSAVIQLNYTSRMLKGSEFERLIEDLTQLFSKIKPAIVYTHNPADKHKTHVAVSCAVIAALRRLNRGDRPSLLLGCEAWRNLDWLADRDKVVHDLGGKKKLARSLIKIFDSQVAAGKRYDAAAIGRRQSNATFLNPDQIDRSDQVGFAMDLTPLIESDKMDVEIFVVDFINRFRNEVSATLRKFLNQKNKRS